LVDYGTIRNERERLMLIQVSEKRWLAEPEALFMEREVDGVCRRMVKWKDPDSTDVFDVLCEELPEDHKRHAKQNDGKIDHYFRPNIVWVARMPSGTLESLSDDEYERLIEVVPAKKLPGRHIKTLGLGARQLNMLLRDGVTSVEELERYSKRELQATRGIGEEGVAEIWKALGRHANDNNGKKSDFLVGLGSGR
jgi:hypothetical protein